MGHTFFLNGLNSKSGGGKSILTNLLSLIHDSTKSDHKYFVLTDNPALYNDFTNSRITLVNISQIFKKAIFAPLTYHTILPRLIKKLNVEVILNIGDIVINSKIPQLYLFDWPYAAYPSSIVWSKMDLHDLIKRKIKLFLFIKSIKRKELLIAAQTLTMKKKLESLYSLKNIIILPNAVSLENISGGKFKDFRLPENKFKLLYLTYYYTHKNLEIFLPLAKKIKDLKLPYCLIITIASNQHKGAKSLLKKIDKEKLNDIIINVGPVSSTHIPSLYKQSDALLIPTLLESFSGTYAEAMYHKIPILTSDMDFASDVCGDAALYFDPLQVNSILNTINQIFKNEKLRLKKTNTANERLNNMTNWNQTFNKIESTLFEMATNLTS